ncbi:MAG: hypothetical protein E5V62_05620 [Mesorhizobium sp.]|uniref:hypothetical protein n=1 Tax=Mesorhizobium sp. TaxID=1871066 RepID=UPI000FD38D50|nr:hypothetical protein [Mesorhizobium sp.]RVD70235.1 hypothetical protein EN751_21795 [Mesorhizobium sp. M4A.F.Ca.ET.029.04.2.1]TIW36648.1 MAG: hypothetical protein E5V62_05620 [Mesorhizobium sp.]
MLLKASVRIRRDLDPAKLSPMEEEQATSEDGLMLNHSYFDMRGYSVADAKTAIAEEADLLAELEASDWDADTAEELAENMIETGEYAGWFDIGTSAAVFALSAAGATPISSCNGGRIGGTHHSDEVPNILFSIEPSLLDPILRSAEEIEAGLINNGVYAELFVDDLLKLHAFAEKLVARLELQ